MQMAELHYKREPSIDFAAVMARAEAILGGPLGSPSPPEPGKPFLLAHLGHPVKYDQGDVPAQTWILASSEPPRVEKYRDLIQQSWRCRNAESLLRGCTATYLVTEMMARGLPHAERVAIFHGVLRAMIEETAPNALAFKHSQQIVNPADYLAAVGDEPFRRPGSLNVRFFKIGTDGDMLMDTRGLSEVGLPDVQCHYRGLEPNAVNRILFNLAIYLYQRGPVIESGNTIPGIDPTTKWVCRHEAALIEPKREVLDLDPGAPFAAGNR